jgi:hypothetical protein
MPMSLSADHRYYHGPSSIYNYLFIEVASAHQFYPRWVELQPNALETLLLTTDILHAPTRFWTDIALLTGAYTLHCYMSVEILTPDWYHVRYLDHGQLLWEYPIPQVPLQRWLTPLSCLIQTSQDLLCGIYILPLKAIPSYWDIGAYEKEKNAGEPPSLPGDTTGVPT